jgi:hypothetical protein
VNFKKLSLFILGLGLLFILIGTIHFLNNLPVRYDTAKGDVWQQFNAGMRQFGENNLFRPAERDRAKQIIIIGAFIMFIGIAVFASAKGKP